MAFTFGPGRKRFLKLSETLGHRMTNISPRLAPLANIGVLLRRNKYYVPRFPRFNGPVSALWSIGAKEK